MNHHNTEINFATEDNVLKVFPTLNKRINRLVKDFALVFDVNYILAATMFIFAAAAQIAIGAPFMAWLYGYYGFTANFWSWLLGMGALLLTAKRPQGTFFGLFYLSPLLIIQSFLMQYHGLHDGVLQVVLDAAMFALILLVYFFNAVVEDLKQAIIRNKQERDKLEQQLIELKGQLPGKDTNAPTAPSA